MSTSPTPPSTNQPPTWPVTPPTHHRDAPAPGYDPSRQWGTGPPPPQPKGKRRGLILLAAAIGVALLVTTAAGVVANTSTLDSGPAPTPPTTPSPGPADPPDTDPGDGSTLPEQEPRPDPEPQTVELPTLTGMTRAEAKQNLTDYGLKATIKYKSTDQYPGGTVISQLPKAGALVLPSTAVTLVVAKARPAPPPSTAPAQNCDPSYPDMCLDPAVEDYDCTGGQATDPSICEGPICVRPPDPFDLDREGDGWGCENG